MSDENPAGDPYAIVIADLRAKRDELDRTIAMLEAMSGGAVPHQAKRVDPMSKAEADSGPGAYLGMSIADAARKLLASRRQPMNNADIYAALTAGGLAMNSAEPLNTIGSVLTRRFHQVGDIVRVKRGVWGLKEWYPNRNFKPAKLGEAKTDANGSGQPSEQPETVPPASDEPPASDRPDDLV